ncbi:hypothetical protein [Sinorhizobium medicae]|uniref:Uncharacterized protein n=1 Tax=Sinorhizobium medicae TaxID=110321 RepID=A0A508X9H1_9HYPH|nr:hypothetical protein [Sinorhizobium medicae]VTZ64565.1 conserved hypothetical protein [Sinorhizobium medicae]
MSPSLGMKILANFAVEYGSTSVAAWFLDPNWLKENMQQIKVLQRPSASEDAALQDDGNVLCHSCNMDKPKSRLYTAGAGEGLVGASQHSPVATK